MRLLLPALCLAALTGCDRAPSLVICNNANCAPPVDLAQDNTIEALRASLALTWEGRPAIDGIEIDTVWDADESKCLFSSDFTTSLGACEASEAATTIAEFLRTDPTPLRFYVKVQAKPLVAPSGLEHTAEQATSHARCNLDLAATIETAANEVGRPVTFMFGEDSAVSQAILAQQWPEEPRGGQIEYRFVYPIDASEGFDGIDPDVVSFDWVSLHDGESTAIKDLGRSRVDLQLWARQATVQTLWAIDYIQPTFVDTNDALIVRDWVGPRH